MLRLIWAELKKIILNTKFVIGVVVVILLAMLLFGNVYSSMTRSRIWIDDYNPKPTTTYYPRNAEEYVAQVLSDFARDSAELDNTLVKMKSLTELDAKALVERAITDIDAYNTSFAALYNYPLMKSYIEDIEGLPKDSIYPELFDTDGQLKQTYAVLLDSESEEGIYLTAFTGLLASVRSHLSLMDAYNDYILYNKEYKVWSFSSMLGGNINSWGYKEFVLSDVQRAYNAYLELKDEGAGESELRFAAYEINSMITELVMGHKYHQGNNADTYKGKLVIVNDRIRAALDRAVGHKITEADYKNIEDVFLTRNSNVKGRLKEIADRIETKFMSAGTLYEKEQKEIAAEVTRYQGLISGAKTYADSYAKYRAIKGNKQVSFADYSESLADSEYTYKSIITSYLYVLDKGLYLQGYSLGLPKVEDYSLPSAPMSFGGIVDWMIYGMFGSEGYNMYGYVSFMMIFLSVIIMAVCVVIGGGLIAGEQQRGTIKMLIIRPYKRWKILTAKLLSTLIIGVALTLATVIILLITGGIFFGYSLAAAPVFAVFNASKVVIMSAFGEMLLKSFFFVISLAIYIVISTLFSVLMKSRTAAVVVTLLLNVVGAILVPALMTWWPIRLLIFANSDLYLFFGRGVLDGSIFFGFSASMCLIYMLVFGGLAYYFFHKRDLN